MEILHICKDYPWFKGAHELFEIAFPNQNRYVLLTNKPSTSVRHLKGVKDLTLVSDQSFVDFKLGIDKYDLVIIHGFTDGRMADIILEEEHSIPFVWFIMGAEMYQNEYIYDQPIYGEMTKKLMKKGLFTRVKDELRRVLRFIKHGTKFSQNGSDDLKQRIALAIKKINWIATFQPEQFDLLRELNAIDPKAKRIHFSYYPLEYILGKDKSEDYSTGKNILLGNSASFTNNHAEALSIMSRLNLSDRQVFVPLSYGNRDYAKKIISYAHLNMGSNFHPLLDFMPLQDYNKLISSCAYVVMNHYRGQAAGNLIASLYKGCKVFMSERSTIYKYLKNLGCEVFSVEVDLQGQNALSPLTVTQIENNRSLMEQQFNMKIIVDSLKYELPKILKG